MPCCAAPGCSYRNTSGKHMHRFPRDPERRKIWEVNVGREGWRANDYSILCEDHFDETQYEQRRVDGLKKLRTNAVPTLFAFSTMIVLPTRHRRTHRADASPPLSKRIQLEHAYYQRSLLAGTREKPFHHSEDGVQQLIGHPEELPSLQGGVSTLNEEVPHPLYVKEEDEELWITQEGECLLGQEEADLTQLPLTIVSVKTEEDEGKTSDSFHWCPSDVQEVVEHPIELPPPLCGESSTLKQKTPQPPHIKKEEEELWITQEGECLLGPQEADLTKLPLTVVSVKIEDDEEKPQVDNLLAPLSDSESEGEVEVPLSSDTDSEGDMRTHADNKHSKKKRGKKCFSCSVCAKIFTHRSNLDKHMRTHTGEKPFNCSICPKSFSLKTHLIQHMRTHTGEKPFNCSVCGKGFTQNGSLTQHLRTHTGEKPFNCAVCGTSFFSRAGLTLHTMKHTGEKTFNCSVCDKSFTHKGSLAQHVRTHTGDKQFSCSACSKSFSLKRYLTQHMKTHTGKKQLNCSVCDKRFSQKRNLTKHMTTHTGEKQSSCSVFGKSVFLNT
ncbi:zinc finger protein 2-like isoform X1 [Entelurus aequoreus]|uniref:zinc finger protein 2-like isoform X1 n=1 Tax=Entelurus aequoreus TaxID=161455 RepID=UPI002B1DC653|nr:zinc finger protein 2-like isoform X1 [Entelurus aequoreus]